MPDACLIFIRLWIVVAFKHFDAIGLVYKQYHKKAIIKNSNNCTCTCTYVSAYSKYMLEDFLEKSSFIAQINFPINNYRITNDI